MKKPYKKTEISFYVLNKQVAELLTFLFIYLFIYL